jgi:hypothetical protein
MFGKVDIREKRSVADTHYMMILMMKLVVF